MTYTFSPLHTGRRALFGILAAAIVISGCATTGGNPMMQVFENPRSRYITAAADDTCAELREPFVKVREAQRQQIGKWAAIGAAAGAAGGAAIYKRNRLLGGVIGGITGLLAGATLGYYADLQKRAEGTENLRKAVFKDARADARSSDKLVKGVVRLNRCRMTELKAIARDVQKGSVTKEQARSRIAAVKHATAEDNLLIDSVSQGLRKRSAIYVNALEKSGADDADTYIAKAEAYKPVVKKPQFTVRRGSAKPISISRRNKRGESSVESVAKNAVELDAMQVAHLAAVDEGIEDINALLL